MGWKPEVKVHNDDTWYQNNQVFATEGEAAASASSLHDRWTQCVKHRAVQVDTPPNYKRVGNTDMPLPPRNGFPVPGTGSGDGGC